MGRQVKIELDDKFPISAHNNLFASSENRDEIWPLIFSKALCVLNEFKWKEKKNFNFDSLVGDGSIMYSLTGLIPETMKISQMSQQNWSKIHRLLNDDEYAAQTNYMVCFSDPNH
jgi:hypothetical protein